MDSIQWFKIQVIYPVSPNLTGITAEEVGEIERLQHGINNEMSYEQDFAYLNLFLDPIMSLSPGCLVIKDAVNKKYYTEIVLQSENVIYAVGKPEAVYKKINEYLDSIPKEEPISEN